MPGGSGTAGGTTTPPTPGSLADKLNTEIEKYANCFIDKANCSASTLADPEGFKTRFGGKCAQYVKYAVSGNPVSGNKPASEIEASFVQNATSTVDATLLRSIATVESDLTSNQIGPAGGKCQAGVSFGLMQINYAEFSKYGLICQTGWPTSGTPNWYTPLDNAKAGRRLFEEEKFVAAKSGCSAPDLSTSLPAAQSKLTLQHAFAIYRYRGGTTSCQSTLEQSFPTITNNGTGYPLSVLAWYRLYSDNLQAYKDATDKASFQCKLIPVSTATVETPREKVSLPPATSVLGAKANLDYCFVKQIFLNRGECEVQSSASTPSSSAAVPSAGYGACTADDYTKFTTAFPAIEGDLKKGSSTTTLKLNAEQKQLACLTWKIAKNANADITVEKFQIPPALALAMGLQESVFKNGAIHEDSLTPPTYSVGLLQIHDAPGEFWQDCEADLTDSKYGFSSTDFTPAEKMSSVLGKKITTALPGLWSDNETDYATASKNILCGLHILSQKDTTGTHYWNDALVAYNGSATYLTPVSVACSNFGGDAACEIEMP
ncbi:MAG: transglycosylase SLT domain-containing protein [Candidatus Diapherotrites archaeon]